jgi:hypothetical protein
MQIFAGSAIVKQIECWLAQGAVDGLTTNPPIMFKDGVQDIEEGARKLAALLQERPLAWKSPPMTALPCSRRHAQLPPGPSRTQPGPPYVQFHLRWRRCADFL